MYSISSGRARQPPIRDTVSCREHLSPACGSASLPKTPTFASEFCKPRNLVGNPWFETQSHEVQVVFGGGKDDPAEHVISMCCVCGSEQANKFKKGKSKQK
jgi:hypothetical protein